MGQREPGCRSGVAIFAKEVGEGFCGEWGEEEPAMPVRLTMPGAD